MRRSFLSLLIVFLSVLWTVPVMANNLYMKEFPISKSGTLEATGLRAAVSGGTIELVTLPQDEGGMNAVQIRKESPGAATNVLFTAITDFNKDSVIFTTKIKTDEIDNTTAKQITLRTTTAGADIVLFQAVGTEVSSSGVKVDNFNLQAGIWYELAFSIKKFPTPTVDMYINGVKVASNGNNNVSLISSGFPQLRFEIGNEGTFYVGDTKLYTPALSTPVIVNSMLGNVDEDVLIDFSFPMDPDGLVPENISIAGIRGSDLPFQIESVADSNGFITSIKVDFVESLLLDNVYTITFGGGVKDAAGQSLSTSTLTFYTPEPDTAYGWGNGVQLFEGTGADISASDYLQKGMMTVKITPINNGFKLRPVSLVTALYKEEKLIDFQYSSCMLAPEESAELAVTINIDNATEDLLLQVMVWKEPIGYPMLEMVEFNRNGRL